MALSPVTLPSLATGSRGKPFFCFYLLLFPREKRENDAPLLLPLVTHWSRVLQHYGCRLTRRRGGGDSVLRFGSNKDEFKIKKQEGNCFAEECSG